MSDMLAIPYFALIVCDSLPALYKNILVPPDFFKHPSRHSLSTKKTIVSSLDFLRCNAKTYFSRESFYNTCIYEVIQFSKMTIQNP